MIENDLLTLHKMVMLHGVNTAIPISKLDNMQISKETWSLTGYIQLESNTFKITDKFFDDVAGKIKYGV